MKIPNLSEYKRYRSLILLGADLTIVAISLMLAGIIDNMGGSSVVGIPGDIMTFLAYVSLMVIVYGISFMVVGIQLSLWTYIGTRELVAIGYSVSIAAIIGYIILSITPINPTSPLRYTFISASLAFIGMSALRVGYRVYRERELYSKHPRQRAFIVGAGEHGYVLLKELQRNVSLNTNVIGFIDSRRKGHIVNGKAVLGGDKDIVKLVEKHKIDLVYIASKSLTRRRRAIIIEELALLNIKVKVMRFDEERSGRNIAHMIEDVSVEDLLGRGQVKLDQQEVSSYLAGKNILVTGAGGSIGGQVVREVIKFRPKAIYMVDVNENSLYLLDRELEFQQTDIVEESDRVKLIPLIINIREAGEVDKLFAKHDIQVVFHAAAHKHVPLMEARPQEAIKNNIFGTKNVIDSAIKYEAERFIMISTDKAVNPTNVMGASKRMTEMLLQAKAGSTQTKLAAVRFGNVLGSNGSVIPIFKEQIKKGGPVTITDTGITRYFMTIPEAVQLVLQAGFYADSGDIFVLDMGKPVKIIDLALNLIRLAGFEPYADIDIVETGLRPGEKMFEELFLDGETHTKTKNDLIFRNQHQDIDRKQLSRSLSTLQGLVADGASAEEIKNALLKCIGQEVKVKEGEVK